MKLYRVRLEDSDYKEKFFKELESALRFVYTEYISDLNCKVDFTSESVYSNFEDYRSLENTIDRVCTFKLNYEGSDFWNNREVIIEQIYAYEYDLERY